MKGLTAKVSRPPQAGRLERRVRPEGQKRAPGLAEGRSPRKSARPRKRRSAARMIAGSACYTSAGGQKGLEAFGTVPSAGTSGCAHKTGDGTNVLSSAAAVGGRLRRMVRHENFQYFFDAIFRNLSIDSSSIVMVISAFLPSKSILPM